jgi:hypothetical protein
VDFVERWRRTCAVKTSQGAPPGMAVQWLALLDVARQRIDTRTDVGSE